VTTFRFIDAQKADFPVAFACRVLGVSRSGYYQWLKEPTSNRCRSDEQLATTIRDIHAEHKGRYGSPRIHQELRARGERVGRKRVARLMTNQGLRGRAPKRFRRTTDSRHDHPIAPNILARNFTAEEPNQAWVGDITYVPTREGWLYLAVLLDLFSRRVVGWATSDTIDTLLALSALNMALSQRQPSSNLVHHTDRDCRYASAEYRRALAAAGITASMSRRGDCWDNAVAESFFATLEKELLDGNLLVSRAHAANAIADYIENYYNAHRLHSSLDYVSPVEYELTAA
jgi:transposase InsO family protein